MLAVRKRARKPPAGDVGGVHSCQRFREQPSRPAGLLHLQLRKSCKSHTRLGQSPAAKSSPAASPDLPAGAHAGSAAAAASMQGHTLHPAVELLQAWQPTL